MAVRRILQIEDPEDKRVLKTRCHPIKNFTPALRALAADMFETMHAANGVGLAAPQIGVSLRLFVIDVATGEDQPSELRVFCNPEIVERTGEVVWEEGCLSFPGVHEDIDRAERVKVRAQDRHGQWFELEAEGLLAVAIQHENDHLDGKLMVDHLGMLRRRVVHREMTKRAPEAAE